MTTQTLQERLADLADVIQAAWHRGRFTAIDLRDGKAVAAAIMESGILDGNDSSTSLTTRTLKDRLRDQARNQASYRLLTPEQTLEWKAAAALDSRDALIAEARKALEFYAKFDNHNVGKSGSAIEGNARAHASPVMIDDGEIARVTIAKLKAHGGEEGKPPRGSLSDFTDAEITQEHNNRVTGQRRSLAKLSEA